MNAHENLKSYIDGELTPQERAEVELELEKNPELRAEKEALEGTAVKLKLLKNTPEPTGRLAAMNAIKVNAKKSQPLSWTRWIPTAGVAAAALGAILMASPLKNSFEYSRRGELSLEMKQVDAESPSFERQQQTESEAGANPQEAPSSAAMQPKGSVDGGAGMAYQEPSADVNGVIGDGVEAKAFDEERTPPNRLRSEAGKSKKAVTEFGNARPLGSSSQSTMNVPAQHGRDMIYQGTIAVEVDNVSDKAAKVTQLITNSGGYIVNQDESEEAGVASAHLVVKVPSKSFESIYNSIKAEGKATAHRTSQDASQEMADYNGRVMSLRSSEQGYIELLKSARNTQERMTYRRALDSIRAELAGYKAQVKRLEELTTLSDLDVTLTQAGRNNPDKSDDWWSDSWSGASSVSGTILGYLGRFAIYLLQLWFIWIPALVYGYIQRKKNLA